MPEEKRKGKFAEDYKTFKARLEGAGKWADYCVRQRELQKAGLARNDQLDILNAEFGRLKTGATPGDVILSEHKAKTVEHPLSKITPAPREEPPPDLALMSQTAAKQLKAKQITDAESIRWVLENIHVDALNPTDAPSLVAWSYYQYAKSSKKAYSGFMETIAPKVLNVKEEAKQDDITEGSTKQMDMIDKLIKRMREESSL